MRPHINLCLLVKKNLRSILSIINISDWVTKEMYLPLKEVLANALKGRSVGNSQTKLEKSDFRSVGVTDSTGLQSRVSYSAHSIIPSETSAFARKARGIYERRDKKFIRKRGHREVKGPTASSVDLTDVPRPKKGWSNEASVHSERFESVPTLGTFQNGKHTDDQKPHPRRRLDGENGSEGCLLCPANQTGGSAMVEIPMGGGDLRVHESPIRPIGCSQTVHQNSQTSGGLDETVWLSDDNIIDDNLLLAPSKEEAQVLARLMLVLFEALGFSVNYQKSVLDPQQSLEFLGFRIDSRSMTVALPAGEIGQNSQSGKEPPGPDFHNRKGASTIHRESQFSNVSHPSGSSFLSGSAGNKTCHPFSLLGPRLSHCCDKPREGGAFVVGGAGETLKQVQPETTVSLPKDSDRCFEIGMGSSLSWRRAGGLWMYKESHCHINYLELLAAFLAIQSFVKSERHLTVYLYMDNVSALTYINKKGGVQSQPLTALAKECGSGVWREQLCYQPHLPCCLKIVAVEESRCMHILAVEVCALSSQTRYCCLLCGSVNV